jgi:fumarylacetoacetase
LRHAYGIVRDRPGAAPHLAARLDDTAFDLRGVRGLPDEVAAAGSLDPLLVLGPRAWADVNGAVDEHLHSGPHGTPIGEVEVLLPVVPGDYVDFYASEHHATNLGHILRPGEDPLPPAWHHLPIGYHGRAGSVVVSGTPVTRPVGLVGPGDRRPSERLDLELELGFVVGTDVAMGQVVAPDDACDHVFGVVLLNDWSARDLQAFEYRPLGPFAGKSFATSIAGWITPLAAIPRCAGVAQDPAPDPLLRADGDWALDLELAWSLNGTEVGHTNARHLWWSFAQMLCHLTANGAGLRRGDLFASGTVSGPDPGQEGALIEATHAGTRPVALSDGTTRAWLEDDDTVVLTGSWHSPDGGGSLAPVAGTIVPATEVH